MKFRIISRGDVLPDKCTEDIDTVYLIKDNWNDFAYKTMFYMCLYDGGILQSIGSIKIAFKGQTTKVPTYENLPEEFEVVDDNFFSLGESVDFYRKLSALPNKIGEKVLRALRDIVVLPDLIDDLRDEEVFGTSLLRYLSLATVRGQFARVFAGKAELTNFNFRFMRPASELLGETILDFNVTASSTPSTNIHAIIGRNGVGKTTLLNGMIEAITDRTKLQKFIDLSENKEITKDYFSKLVSISFSAFDPFTPPQEQSDPAKGTGYSYIGLKYKDENRHKTIVELRKDCVRALIGCFCKKDKTERWLNAIEKLGSDENFASMELEQLKTIYEDRQNQSDSGAFENLYQEKIDLFLSQMSSGHAIVLLTITRLIETVEEKTLVLLDEPESHLHPPLLSAFIRALGDLLHNLNGVAVIATHSPVVLQEIPRSCVWKIYRVGSDIQTDRPKIKTFGENVGTLTSEVFGLEVTKSGFHSMLCESVKSGRSYAEIIDDYNNQLGFEGRAILKVLITDRDRINNHDATE